MLSKYAQYIIIIQIFEIIMYGSHKNFIFLCFQRALSFYVWIIMCVQNIFLFPLRIESFPFLFVLKFPPVFHFPEQYELPRISCESRL